MQYQGVQNKEGELTLKVTRELSGDERGWINEEAIKYFKNDLILCLKENVEIHDKKGKLKDFVSTL